MQKISFYILISGLILGIIVGAATVHIALAHNPQNEYTDNSEDLILLFFAWAGAGSFPFSLTASVIELYKHLKEKPWENGDK